ncbi:hypothetical protein AALA24_14340 [Anaerovoracaceae bacterium 42-11]
MKNIKNFDEREKLLYDRCRSQTLSIIIFEIFVAVIANSALQLSSQELQIGMLVLIAVPVVFYQVKMAKICNIESEDIFGNFLLAIIWSIYYFNNNKDAGALYFVVFLPWCLAFYSIFVWYKQRKNKEDER